MESRVPVEEAMEMSLDQYISEAGIPEPMSSKRSDRNKNSRSERRGWRYFSDKTAADSEEDEDNDDDVFEDIKHEVDENKASVLDMQKLFGDADTLPNIRSNQWRLMPLNVQSNRPSGMPPLVPVCVADQDARHKIQPKTPISTADKRSNESVKDITVEVDNVPSTTVEVKSDNNIVIEVDNAVDTGNNTNPTKKLRRRNLWSNKNIAVATHNADNNVGRSTMRPPDLFKPFKLSVHQRIDYSRIADRQRRLAGMQRQQQQQLVQHCTNMLSPSSSSFPPGSLAAGVMATVAAANQTAHANGLAVLPSVANALLQQIDAMQRAKMANKYDPKLQSEIANLQGKPLMYVCNGAGSQATPAVVSSDGPGIEIDIKQTHKTDLSMNHRFA